MIPSQSYQLSYNIAEQFLEGVINDVEIHCLAGSGGRAGAKDRKNINWWLQNNPFATHVHYGQHGYGPLPMGFYYMHPHEKKANMIRLEPFKENRMFGRSGFLIHPTGEIGSHGCIVPYKLETVIKIRTAVKSYIDLFQKRPILRVFAQGGNLTDKLFTG